MALIARLKTLASATSLIYIFATLCSTASVRQVLARLFSPFTHPFRFAALVIALLLNFKSFPLVWHARFFKILGQQVYFQRETLPRDALFRPIMSLGYAPIPETDFNGHKSNSTYFADLDMARTELVSCLLRKGVRNARAKRYSELQYQATVHVDAESVKDASNTGEKSDKPAKPSRALFAVALGAVSCHFKKEIKPYQGYEIWTRILSWDQKWIYLVSHIVKPGAVPPENFALQPWKKGKVPDKPIDTSNADLREEWKSAVFATSLAKYVIKHGRQTVPPEIVLRNSDLLPPKPGEGANGNSAKPFSDKTAQDEWTWEGVEQERQRGLRLAEHFGALDGPEGLHDEFPVSGGKECSTRVEVLGCFKGTYL